MCQSNLCICLLMYFSKSLSFCGSSTAAFVDFFGLARFGLLCGKQTEVRGPCSQSFFRERRATSANLFSQHPSSVAFCDPAAFPTSSVSSFFFAGLEFGDLITCAVYLISTAFSPQPRPFATDHHLERRPDEVR